MLNNVDYPWLLFCIAFALMLLSTYLMGRLSHTFITMDPVRRNVSMLSLEFPSKNTEIANVMSGIFRLPEDERKASVRSLKGQLLLDYFMFMPGTYGAIFIMCVRIADKMSVVGHAIFTFLAWAQVCCFVLDAIENAYFWSQIKANATPASNTMHRLMQLLELLKWGLALLGGVCGFSAIACFWLSGQYHIESLRYVALFFGLIVLFAMAGKKKPAVA